MFKICYTYVENCRKEIAMIKKCDLTLKSIVDGVENLFCVEGRLEDHAGKVKVCYRENPAIVHIVFSAQGEANIEREGDYTLRLPLKQGESTQGELGINGNTGDLGICTHYVEYSFTEVGLSARLRYDLLLGEDVQEMELQIQANARK